MSTLSKLRRMVHRDHLSVREASRRLGISRNTAAKWLEADPSVILLDDPSRGVDMGAKEDMHAIIAQMAASRKVVLYTSSDLEEMAKVCDRVIVFFGGRAVGELASSELSEHGLLESINVGAVTVNS